MYYLVDICAPTPTDKLKAMARRKVVFEYFQQLPPELRQQIYKFALQQTLPVRLSRKHDKPNRRHATNLLLASRQVYTEATQIFYSINVFRAWEPRLGYKMLKTMGPKLKTHLRSFMCVLGRDSFSSGMLRLLGKCINLRQLTISTKLENFMDLCESGAFDDFHGFSQLEIHNKTMQDMDFTQLFKQILSPCPVDCIWHTDDDNRSVPRHALVNVR